jgi:hypothetical protein
MVAAATAAVELSIGLAPLTRAPIVKPRAKPASYGNGAKKYVLLPEVLTLEMGTTTGRFCPEM